MPTLILNDKLDTAFTMPYCFICIILTMQIILYNISELVVDA